MTSPMHASLPTRPAVRTIAALILSGLAAGCGNLSGLGGGSSLSCGLPDGVHCDSVSNTYQSAIHGGLPGQTGRSRTTSVPDPDADPGPASVPAMRQVKAIETAPLPVRTAPRVLRVWIKPWIDTEGDLHDQSFVYLPVEDGRWQLDDLQKAVRQPYVAGRTPAATPVAAAPGPAPAQPGKTGSGQQGEGTGSDGKVTPAKLARSLADSAAKAKPFELFDASTIADGYSHGR